MSRVVSACMVIPFLSIAASSAAACEWTSSSESFGITIDQRLTVDANSLGCKYQLGDSFGSPDIQFLGIRVIEHAKHGQAGSNGTTTYAYKPDRGYRGSDFFSLESRTVTRGVTKVTLIRITVTVR